MKRSSFAAAEEERFNRQKHCAGFPTQAIHYCLQAAGINVDQLDHVGISRDPAAHLHKKVLFAASRAGREAVSRNQKSEVRSHKSVESGTAVIDDPVGVDSSERSDFPDPGTNGKGNGNGHGIISQIKNRLANAGKVRNLKSELAHALGVSPGDIRAQFHRLANEIGNLHHVAVHHVTAGLFIRLKN